MKVIGLISGGKDSCYNLMQCVEQGHEIVCLVNLRPPEGMDELDSFMYQSVGHEAVEIYSEAMALPLYRRIITGRPENTDYDYQITANDEVEDLFQVLVDVLEQYPDAKGVSAGAIWSNYQKNRVENVCERLGLTPLCYLWAREQKTLLAEMNSAGVEAVIVKVAALGLDETYLGRSLNEVYDDLIKLEVKYGLNVCGEGGEYETFVIDCPLFKKRIVIDQSSIVLHSKDAFAPVAFLRLERLHLEAK